MNTMTKRKKMTLALSITLSLHTGFFMGQAFMMEAPMEVHITQSTAHSLQNVSITGNKIISSARIQGSIVSLDATEMKKNIIKLYSDAGYNLVDATIMQDDGKTTIIITESILNKVFIDGNKQSSAGNIRQMLPALKEGIAPNVRYLSCQIMLANDNGFRQMAVNFRPAGEGKVDAYVTVAEVPSVKTVVSVDNTGDNFTGQLRTNVTMIDGNVGGKGQTAVVSYTTSPDHLNDVKQVGLYYNIPLVEANDNIYLTASYSDTNSGRIIDQGLYSLDASGKGSSVGVHYVHSLQRTPSTKESLDFGLDARQYKNTTLLNVASVPVNIGVDINSMPLALTYQKSNKTPDTATSYSLGYTHNISGGDKNSDAQYELYRAGTTANYQVWRTNGNYQHMLPSGWLVNMNISGQYTAERLIYPEQFGLGGAHSLRGMNERDVAGDRGIQAGVEFYTPEIAKGQRLVGFLDAGRFWNINPVPGELTSDSAATIGLGWRYNDTTGYNLIADWGYVLDGTANTEKHSSKFHFVASKVF